MSSIPFSSLRSAISKVIPDTKEDKNILKNKKKLYESIAAFGVSKKMWLAFLLPNDQAFLEQYSKPIVKLVGEDLYVCKLQALDVLKNLQKTEALGRIRDPHHKKSRMIKLLLLEIVDELQRDTISKKEVTKHQHAWVTMADHFGMWSLRYRIEDAVFAVQHPKDAALVASLMKRKDKQYKELFAHIRSIVDHSLKKHDITEYEVQFRHKNLYGVHQKMQIKERNINHITDLYGFRIIVEGKKDCYRVLEALHHLWRPYPEEFKDYINNPKPNGYQSIHTTVHCLENTTVEFQIRTRDMDIVSKYGPASHARYKQRLRRG